MHVEPSPSPLKSRNTKLDEIRERETEAESKIPIPDRHLAKLRNTKLDDIRQREADGLSKRQAAAARLEEIREQNAMPRLVSSAVKKSHQPNWLPPGDASKAVSGSREAKPVSPVKTQYGAGGVRLPDTPVTVYKSRHDREGNGGAAGGRNDAGPASKENRNVLREGSKPGAATSGVSRVDLQQLGRRISSSSPRPEQETKRGALTRRGNKSRSSTSDNIGGRRRPITRDPKDGDTKSARPTVGFAGLRRTRSTESTGSKRSSIHSEGDPVDRIEAEAKLFALTDNHSERGSVRAPSPFPEIKDSEDDGGLEATPRARKDDLLSMPTPRVTGAFVETPAPAPESARERIEKFDSDMAAKDPLLSRRATLIKSTRQKGRETDSRDTASDPGTSDTEQITTKPAPPLRRRAHSLPRPRQPLKNSANPPSVKDDVRELRRINNIEDSTVDDFDDMLDGHPNLAAEVAALPDGVPSTDDGGDDDTFDLKMERSLLEQENVAEKKAGASGRDEDQHKGGALIKDDIATYERMNKSLTRSLYSVHDARRGMERLGDSLANDHHEKMPETTGPVEKQPESDQRRDAAARGIDAAKANTTVITYIQVPVPRLYSRKPYFHLTVLGLITLALSVWGLLESGMCAVYCSPSSCGSPPCVWSYDDPSFGKALPVKIDQWVTGGAGREGFNIAAEQFGDWLADVLDSAHGRDIRDVNIADLSFEGKRSHRRRLRKKGFGNVTQHAGSIPANMRARWATEYLEDDYDDDDTSIGEDKRVY